MKSKKSVSKEVRDWEILKLVVKTKTSEEEVDLSEDLKIDIDNLNEDFCNQPSKYAWWATVASQAKSIADRKELEVEIQEDYVKRTLIGVLDEKVRKSFEIEGEKITESKVTNAIYADEEYIEEKEKLNLLKRELIELRETANTLAVAREAMNQRKDSLISLGAQLRSEGSQTDLNIKKQIVKDVINSKR